MSYLRHSSLAADSHFSAPPFLSLNRTFPPILRSSLILSRTRTMPAQKSRVEITPLSTCAACETPQKYLRDPLKRCGKCKTTLYCSRMCQASDWQGHKARCGAIASPTHIIGGLGSSLTIVHPAPAATGSKHMAISARIVPGHETTQASTHKVPSASSKARITAPGRTPGSRPPPSHIEYDKGGSALVDQVLAEMGITDPAKRAHAHAAAKPHFSQPLASSSPLSSSSAAPKPHTSSAKPSSSPNCSPPTRYDMGDSAALDNLLAGMGITDPSEIAAMRAASMPTLSVPPRTPKKDIPLPTPENAYLSALPLCEAIEQLIDAFKLRCEDESLSNARSADTYGGGYRMPLFRAYLDAAEERGTLPGWWNWENRETTEGLVCDKEAGVYLWDTVSEQELREKWEDQAVPTKLRKLAEEIYGMEVKRNGGSETGRKTATAKHLATSATPLSSARGAAPPAATKASAPPAAPVTTYRPSHRPPPPAAHNDGGSALLDELLALMGVTDPEEVAAARAATVPHLSARPGRA